MAQRDSLFSIISEHTFSLQDTFILTSPETYPLRSRLSGDGVKDTDEYLPSWAVFVTLGVVGT
jgi:hypothetical protein